MVHESSRPVSLSNSKVRKSRPPGRNSSETPGVVTIDSIMQNRIGFPERIAEVSIIKTCFFIRVLLHVKVFLVLQKSLRLQLFLGFQFSYHVG